MRLLSRISIYYLCLSTIVLGIAGMMLYLFLRIEISKEMEEQLELQFDMVASELQNKKNIEFPLVTITPGKEEMMLLPKVFKDTLIYDHLQDVTEGYYYFEQSKRINGLPYRIRVMTTYIGWENYARTIIYMFLLIAALLIAMGTLINYFINRNIWKPFMINLRRMQGYSVSSREELQLARTKITEFQEMNTVLTDLAARGKREYTALKEFTENASHEIQTPLSILKTRLETISQVALDSSVIRPLADAKQAVNRLSKVNKSLLLLAKLENDAFVDKAWISIDEVIQRNFELLEDLFQHRMLKLEQKLSPKLVYASSTLMDILISNMLSNIINYSDLGSSVSIVLENQKLVFSNEAPPLTFPASNLFFRFSKGTEGNNGRNGLGLSIVKQICVNNNWDIAYDYQNKLHIFRIELQ